MIQENHELSRILHGVDIIILITLFCQNCKGLARSSKVLELGGGGVLEKSLNFCASH